MTDGRSLVPVRLPEKRSKQAEGSKGKSSGTDRKRRIAYSEELGREICWRLAGGETLIEICRDDDMPAEQTVRQWEREDRTEHPDSTAPGFAAMYADARADHIEHRLERLKLLAENPLIGVKKTRREAVTKHGDIVELHGEEIHDNVARASLMIEAEKWSIAKIGWRVYGTRSAIAEKSEGSGDGPDRLIIIGGLPDDEPETPPNPFETDMGDEPPPED